MISEDRKVSRKTRTDCSRLTPSAVVEPAGQRLSPGGVGARHLRRMFLPGLVSALSSWLLWNVSSSQARATGLRAAWVSPAPWAPSLTTPLPEDAAVCKSPGSPLDVILGSPPLSMGSWPLEMFPSPQI